MTKHHPGLWPPLLDRRGVSDSYRVAAVWDSGGSRTAPTKFYPAIISVCKQVVHATGWASIVGLTKTIDLQGIVDIIASYG